MNPDKRKTAECLSCKSSFKYGKNCSGKYCSNKCQQQHYHDTRIEEWLNGSRSPMKKGCRLCCWARDYLIQQSSCKCSKCGWNEVNPTTNKCPLEIDHIDGDATNHHPSNLRVLCPNCHSLTPTYRALNKGQGSSERLRYSRLH